VCSRRTAPADVALTRDRLDDCRAAVLVSDARRGAVVEQAVRECRHLKAVVLADDGRPRPSSAVPVVDFDTLLDGSPVTLPARRRSIDVDLAALVHIRLDCRARGVMLTHPNIVSAATSITPSAEHRRRRDADVLPLSLTTASPGADGVQGRRARS
jgi:hypothetical protein